MGFKSNWLAFHGFGPEEAQRRLGVAPTGIRSVSPTDGFAGRMLSDGRYLVVEGRLEEEAEDTWDLAELSRGCFLWAATEIDGAGYAYLSEWQDGELNWRMSSDGSEYRLDGDLPAAFRPALEQMRAEVAAEEGIDDPDYIDPNFVLWLARHVTDYVCGDVARGPEYEELEEPATAAIIRGLAAESAAALAQKGLVPVEQDGRSPGLRYFAETGLPGVRVELTTTFEAVVPSRVRISWDARLLSSTVQELRDTLPSDAGVFWRSGSRLAEVGRSCLRGTVADRVVGSTDEISDAVKGVVSFVSGPMAEWAARCGSLAGLVESAKETAVQVEGAKADCQLIQATAALCIQADRQDLAAEVMGRLMDRASTLSEYVGSRMIALDGALCDRYPDYAVARGLSGVAVAPER